MYAQVLQLNQTWSLSPVLSSILPSQQSVIDDLVRHVHASTGKYAIIATQPMFAVDGKSEWHPADCFVNLALAPLQFNPSAKLDARLPQRRERTAAFGRFEEMGDGIIYHFSTPGVLGAAVRLETVVWSPEQKALVEKVGCLPFWILILLFKKKKCESLPTALASEA